MDFDTLYDEVFPSLFRYCQRLTGDPDVAEDVAQEAFVRMLESQVVGERAAVRVWLFKVATHLVRDRWKLSTNRKRLLATHPVTPGAGPDPERETERREEVASVRSALDTLNPRDRELLLMREEGFSYREMAEAVGVSGASVGTLLARAQKRFAEVWTAQLRAAGKESTDRGEG